MRLLALALLLFGSFAACSGGSPTTGGGSPQRDPSGEEDVPPLPRASVVLEPPGHEPITVHVEVANTNPTRQRGLMYRREMAEDAGMLFLFDEPEHLSFWMHNTYIPLDMVFIGADKRVVGVAENCTPLTDDGREVEGDSQYVLEVNAGFARRAGIATGTLVRFVDVPEGAAPRGRSRRVEDEE